MQTGFFVKSIEPYFAQRRGYESPRRPSRINLISFIIISSAHFAASAIALIVAGTLLTGSELGSFHAIKSTRLRPSSEEGVFRLAFASLMSGAHV